MTALEGIALALALVAVGMTVLVAVAWSGESTALTELHALRSEFNREKLMSEKRSGTLAETQAELAREKKLRQAIQKHLEFLHRMADKDMRLLTEERFAYTMPVFSPEEEQWLKSNGIS